MARRGDSLTELAPPIKFRSADSDIINRRSVFKVYRKLGLTVDYVLDFDLVVVSYID